MKRCVTCHEDKPLEAFNRRVLSLDGRQDRCRDCCKAWYARNRAAHIAHAKERTNRVRDIYRLRLVEYLTENACVDCGEPDVRVLDFDHRPGTDKHNAVAQMIFQLVRWETIEAEIAKCDVRCANCHRRITAARAGQWRHLWWTTQHPEVDASARLERLLPAR